MAIETPPTPPAIPDVPDRANRSTFSQRMYNMFVFIAGDFMNFMGDIADNVAANATDAASSASSAEDQAASAKEQATAAAASRAGAEAASFATVWISGNTYAVGDVRYSPINYQSYRRKTVGGGTTDPANDSANWHPLVPSSTSISATAKTADYTAVAGDNYAQDTSAGAITVTLPSSPSVGDAPILIRDLAGTFAALNLMLARNGNKIEGAAEDFIVDLNNFSGQLVWSGSTYGWVFL